ncbi:MAG: haloacid dehalogenase type II [Cognaticolwellia sp.]
MKKVLAFDVYGTLIDTHGVIVKLKELIGEQATVFSEVWRQKQLEYSFRRGLMKRYEDFSVCTRQSLDYSCDVMSVQLSSSEKKELLNLYQYLPAFVDVEQGLKLLSENYQLVAFSNGAANTVDNLLSNAGIRQYFSDIISADEIKTFKPDPEIYNHLLARTESSAENTWLISSNPFDVIGAISSKINAAWIARTEKSVFDPWDITPNLIVKSLLDLNNKI